MSEFDFNFFQYSLSTKSIGLYCTSKTALQPKQLKWTFACHSKPMQLPLLVSYLLCHC